MLQCMEHSHAHAALRFTAQSVPNVQMGRIKGVGMPRAKKNKPEQQQEAGPSSSTPAPTEDAPPSPPQRPKPAARQPLPPSPGRKARQDAGIALREALKAEKRYTKLLRKAEKVWLATEKIHEEMLAHVERMQEQKDGSGFKELKLLHKAEIFKMEELQALLDASHAVGYAELHRCKAQLTCKDLQIARLTPFWRFQPGLC